jgi:phospholipid/cholesterol/gamma-HCH transport system substrate-binding protein
MADDRQSMEADEPQTLSPESKVGLFVLAGLAILLFSILMLGDIHFRPMNNVTVRFNSVEGITDKSPVKVSGVEVGSVKNIHLSDGYAELSLSLNKSLAVYKNARVRIRSTGIIGTKFIALDPGHAVPPLETAESQRVRSGDTLVGEESLSLDELMERVAKSLDDVTDGGKLGSNLNATMANLRSITDSLNAAIGQQRQSMINIVKNTEDFTAYAKSVAAHLDDVLSHSKEEIKEAIHNLRETLDKSNSILAGVQRGEGTIGALFTDKKTADEVRETVSNLKQTSESAKEVLGRFTKVRAFWIVQARRDFKAGVYHGDFGLRLEPRPNKFYEIMGQNLSTRGSSSDAPNDFERTNTITALIGGNRGPFTLAVGVIKSRAGLEARVRPFQSSETPLSRLELMGQGFDFGRDATIKGRRFKKPNYTAGARVHVNDYVTAGVEAEDIAETTNLNGLVNISFEDKDLAYLLGFVSFAK